MKKLTCKDLGGPCDEEITGDSFEEVGEKCKNHVIEQIQKGDAAHATAAQEMKNATPEEQKQMMAKFKQTYDEAPEV